MAGLHAPNRQRTLRPMRAPLLAGMAAAICLGTATPLRGVPPSEPGLAAGEVGHARAGLWARCDGAGTARFVVRDGRAAPLVATAPTGAEHDFTAQVLIEGLAPERQYIYRVTCEPGGVRREGRFATAPPPDAPRAVRFAWGGDLGGQNVCRDAARGYFVFDAIARREPAFFVALGDMIYADDPCRPVGLYGNRQVPGPPAPAGHLAGFHAAWRYNRADPAFRRFLARHPVFAVWDDHEVTNDFGPHHDSGQFTDGRRLLAPGLIAFLDYNPLRSAAGAERRLYRTARWGRHLELFLLDTRQYRDPNGAPDEPGGGKSMLGAEQRAWLEKALVASDATWRVIVTSVPLSVPTGGAGRPQTAGRTADDPGASPASSGSCSGSCGPTTCATSCGSPPTSISPRLSACARSPTRPTSSPMRSRPAR